MDADHVSVVGIVATYRRPVALRQLLDSLTDSTLLTKVIVVDNGLQDEAATVCKQAAVPVDYHRPEFNLGCGGGVARGLELGLKSQKVTHFCLFDDDAQATLGGLDAIIRGLKAASAAVAVPLVLNAQGHVSWFPGLQSAEPWRVIRRPGLTPIEYRRLCGSEPVAFTWSPWPVMAVTAQVVRDCGFPRDDFWLCAEDLEYSLRMTYAHRGVLIPMAVWAICLRPPQEATNWKDLITCAFACSSRTSRTSRRASRTVVAP